MNGHDDHAEESVGPETPVSEYTLLAGSPRPIGGGGAATATTEKTEKTQQQQQQQQNVASPSSSESNGAFALKSPFAKKRRDDEEEEKKSAADGEGHIDDAHLLGRDFEREMVDVLILDSPKQSTMLKQNSQLDQIQEARASHEENGDDGDGEENKKDSGGQGNYVRAHSQEDGDDGDDDDEEEEAYRYVYLNSPEENTALAYCSNTVVTSRFTIYNFIPKLLFYEFSKLANAYFLVISVMQTVKPISNTGGFPASLPALTIIVLIDMFFACLEDYKRHKADHTANELPCLRFSLEKRAFEQAKWHHLLVGDVVKLHNREAVPADLVILAACEPEPENPAGICYVETKSLDGETNLKLRQGVEATYTTVLSDEQVADIAGVVVCETPNNSIHRFNGTISLKNGKKEAITTNSVVLRGSTLRNTEYIYGLVVNTGPDTKIMMASSNTPMKWSNMERRLNQQILYICALMIALCLTGAIASSVWNHSNLSSKEGEKAWYLYDRQTTAVKAPVGNFFIQVLYYFLLLNSFIPVSLYVSMTSVKFMQAYFMNNDLEMYHEESDTPFQVRTMSLNEELGQIDYIFSDKTGTLTCNIMEFRKCSINGVAYGMGETEVGIAAKKRRQAEQDGLVILEEREDERKSDPKNRHREVRAPFVNYQDDAIFDALSREGSKQAATINSFFEHLGICHTVMPEKAPDGSLRLSASSPDEQALVAAAACFGYKFVARSPGKAMVEYFSCLADQDSASSAQPDKSNQVNAYHVLEVLEFNSTRKRMSVIAKMPNGKLKLLCKGADTVMYERLRETTDSRVLQMRNKTLQDMEMFASEGLRTLVIAEADVNEKFFEGWVVRYRTAINDMRQIELRRLGEKNDIDRLMEEIEVNLEILGATAIEDRLQAEVPDTIHKLRQASIKIWMLTGDKEETAINIGFACRLLTPDVERVVISADTHPDLASIMEELERYSTLRANTDDENDLSNSDEGKHVGRRYRDSTETPTTATESDDHRPLTRIESIAHINSSQEELGLVIDGETLEVALEECPELLLSVAEKCVAVIACRVSPAQKAQLVHLVRDNNPAVRTLAIGDGANDVSMIQAAHVGVGISGQEGMQAANSSDYAIAQFRFLSRLLLVHGRWNYVRMGKLILYIFYKNVMMNLTQFWYMIFTGFSGQKFFLEWGLQGYNLLFTALPIVLISTFEQDVPANLAHNYPVLYRIGQENSHFNTKIVWAWITSCIWESLIISFGTLYGMRYLSENGDTPTMWVYGCTAFTIVLLVVTLKLCLHQQMWWPIHLVIYVCSASLWVVTAAVISNGNSISSAYWNGVFSNSFGVQVFWLLVPLLTIAALSRDFLWKGYIRAFQPSYKHLAQEVHAFKLDRFADKLLAFPPAEKIPTEDMESHSEQQPPSAGTARRTSISEALKYTVAAGSGSAHMLPVRPIAARQGVRRSVARGSAFSYDAESVMVESFMATERYNNLEHPQEARTLFERHASRGSMAFHGLPDSEAVAHALNAIDGSAPAPRGRERLHSTGNIFRGARHSFARRRLTATTLNATGANGSGSGSSFTGGNRNSMTTLTPRDDGLSPGYAYHRGLSIGGADDGLGTPHSGGETTPNHQQQQQRPPVHLVRRYTMPKFNRQQSM